MFEEAELFQTLADLKRTGCERMETSQGQGAIGVEAEVFPDRGALMIAIVGDGGSGEVECAAVRGSYDLDGVWIGEVLRCAKDLEGRDLNVLGGKRAEEGSEVVGAEERFVTLDIDIDLRGVELGDGVDTIRAALQIGRG